MGEKGNIERPTLGKILKNYSDSILEHPQRPTQERDEMLENLVEESEGRESFTTGFILFGMFVTVSLVGLNFYLGTPDDLYDGADWEKIFDRDHRSNSRGGDGQSTEVGEDDAVPSEV